MPNGSQEIWKITAVRCLSGSRADERPLSFLADEGEIAVHSIRESWREPDFLHFRVEANDGRVFDLRHHEFEHFWEMRERGEWG